MKPKFRHGCQKAHHQILSWTSKTLSTQSHSFRWTWMLFSPSSIISTICVSSLDVFGLKFCSFPQSIGMCRMRRFLAVVRSFFHSSLLCAFSCHSSPPTIPPSSLTSACHLFLGLPLNLVPKFIYNTLLEILFSSTLLHVQTNVIYLTLLPLFFWRFADRVSQYIYLSN